MTKMTAWLRASALFLSLVFAPHASQACGRLTIANMNWQSAEVLAHIDQFILKNGYACEAEPAGYS